MEVYGWMEDLFIFGIHWKVASMKVKISNCK